MEIIRKNICLENSRSRVQGLLPFIPFNIDVDGRSNPFIYPSKDDTDGNYGGFPANLTNGMSDPFIYKDIMKDYNDIQDMLRHGIKLRYIHKGSGNVLWTTKELNPKTTYEYTPKDINCFSRNANGHYHWESSATTPSTDVIAIPDYDHFYKLYLKYANSNFWETGSLYFGFCQYVEKNIIGELTIPATIEGDKVPPTIYFCDIAEWLDWMRKNSNSTDCCTRILWNEKGGQAMLDFLSLHEGDYKKGLHNAVAFAGDGKSTIPYITVPVLLSQSIQDMGVMTDYGDEETAPAFSGNLATRRIETNFKAESRLQEFITGKVITDAKGEKLPGSLFVHSVSPVHSGSTQDFFYEYDGEKWMAMEDDAAIAFMAGNYETYNILEEIKVPETGKKCAILYGDVPPEGTNRVLTTKLHMPYVEMKPINITSLSDSVKIGSFITDITSAATEEGETIEFTYVIDALYTAGTEGEIVEYDENTGTVYNEKYPYYPDSATTASLDIISGNKTMTLEVAIPGDIIDYKRNTQTVYDDTLGEHITRDAVISDIKEYTAMAIWNSGTAVTTAVFKEDYLMGITDGVIADVDVEINRGVAAAYENHFALGECNTMEDLVNYRNNLFKI